MTRVALVIKPVSPRAVVARREVETACARAGLESPLVLPTTVEEPGPPQVRYAVDRGFDRIIAAGGDGTVRLVAGALADLQAGTEQGPLTLGVVPIGTADLFARTARLPVRDLRAAAQRAVTAPGRATDLGRAAFETASGERREEPFLTVAGLGQDAASLGDLTERHKEATSWLGYFLPGLRRLRHRGHRLTLTRDGQELATGPLWSLLAVNAARLPAGAAVVPGARLEDGWLHLTLVSPRGLLDWAKVADAGLNPRYRRDRAGGRTAPDGHDPRYPRDHRALAYRPARTVTVTSDEPVPAQVDGDVIGEVVGATFTIAPGALSVAR